MKDLSFAACTAHVKADSLARACVATAARLLPFSLKPMAVRDATISGSGCTA